MKKGSSIKYPLRHGFQINPSFFPPRNILPISMSNHDGPHPWARSAKTLSTKEQVRLMKSLIISLGLFNCFTAGICVLSAMDLIARFLRVAASVDGFGFPFLTQATNPPLQDVMNKITRGRTIWDSRLVSTYATPLDFSFLFSEQTTPNGPGNIDGLNALSVGQN